MSQSSVSRCINDVTNFINDYLMRRHVRFPMTPIERARALLKFDQSKRPFPGAFASVDGTIIKVKAPQEHEEAYVNHHGVHSINAQLVSAYQSS